MGMWWSTEQPQPQPSVLFVHKYDADFYEADVEGIVTGPW